MSNIIKKKGPNKLLNNQLLSVSILIIILVLPIMTGAVYLSLFSVNLPYWDQWVSDIFLGIKYHSGDGTISDFLQLHNDLRPIIPFIIMVITHIKSNFNIISEIFLSYIFYIISFCIISVTFIRQEKLRIYSIIALIPISMYYFNLYILGSLLWGLSVFYSVFLIFVISMFYFLDRSFGIDKWFVLSIISAVFCMFSFTSGIFIWVGGIVTLILKPGFRKVEKFIIWSLLAGLALYINYIYLGFREKGIHGYSGYSDYLVNLMAYPIHKTFCFFGTIGSNIIHDTDYTFFAGIILCFIILAIILLNWKDLDFEKTAIWYGYIIYSLFVSFLLTISRSGNGSEFGPVDMIIFIPAIRHFPSTILLLVAVYFLVIHYHLKNRNEIELNNKRNYEEITSKKYTLNSIFVGFVVLMVIFGAAFHFIPGLLYGNKWFFDEKNKAEIFASFDNMADEELLKIYPNTSHIKKIGEYFRDNQLNLYDIPNQNLYVNNILINRLRNILFHLLN